MTKHSIHSQTLAETAYATKPSAPSMRGGLAAMTVLAVGVSLILGTALPVRADREAAICAAPIGVTQAQRCPSHP